MIVQNHLNRLKNVLKNCNEKIKKLALKSYSNIKRQSYEIISELKTTNYKQKNEKDKLMEMVNTQDFIDGFWEENEKTQIIKEKYKKEFNLLEKLKNKNIDNKVAMTIIIIYYIHQEYPDLLNELMMIIKKAKLFIEKQTHDSYENIIKEIKI